MAYDYKGFVTDLIMGFCGDTLDATRWDTLRDKIAAALEAELTQARAERDDARKAAEARVEALEAAASRFLLWAATPTGFKRKGNDSDKVDLLVIESVEEFKESRAELRALLAGEEKGEEVGGGE